MKNIINKEPKWFFFEEEQNHIEELFCIYLPAQGAKRFVLI